MYTEAQAEKKQKKTEKTHSPTKKIGSVCTVLTVCALISTPPPRRMTTDSGSGVQREKNPKNRLF